jgi:hypothetical protein
MDILSYAPTMHKLSRLSSPRDFSAPVAGCRRVSGQHHDVAILQSQVDDADDASGDRGAAGQPTAKREFHIAR